jgi:hypothetical protein
LVLTANAAKSSSEQLTLIRIFEELRGRGYDGGYDAVRRYETSACAVVTRRPSRKSMRQPVSNRQQLSI